MLFAMFFGVLLLSGAVQIDEPQQKLVLNTSELQRLCSSRDKDVFACTLFTAETLRSDCHERGGLWHQQLSAHLSPVMLLSRPRDAMHEWLHVNDLQLRLESWIGEMGSVSYESLTDCELAATARIDTFPDVMNGFRRESNEQYHE